MQYSCIETRRISLANSLRQRELTKIVRACTDIEGYGKPMPAEIEDKLVDCQKKHGKRDGPDSC